MCGQCKWERNTGTLYSGNTEGFRGAGAGGTHTRAGGDQLTTLLNSEDESAKERTSSRAIGPRPRGAAAGSPDTLTQLPARRYFWLGQRGAQLFEFRFSNKHNAGQR